jgi:hypothetical protein
MTLDARKEKAVALILSIPKGSYPENMFAPDFSAWTGISHHLAGDVYRQRSGIISKIFKSGLTITIERVTAEEDRVAIQAHGEGVLFNDAAYVQDYHFLVIFDEQDRVRHFREYIDTQIVHDVLRPAMEQWSREHEAA